MTSLPFRNADNSCYASSSTVPENVNVLSVPSTKKASGDNNDFYKGAVGLLWHRRQ